METSKKPSKIKKELTPTQEKVKFALNWTVNVLCIILIIFALVVAILTIIRATNKDHVTRVGDTCYFSVVSDSMEPTFKKNDIIVTKAYDGNGSDLKIGQVITFKFVRYYGGVGYDEYNSHRIVDIEKSGNTVTAIRTRGDKQGGDWRDALEDSSTWDPTRVVVKDIVAVWGDVEEVNGELVFTGGKIMKGMGALVNFMQDPIDGKTRFFCLIVLPLILLFVIYAFILVRTLIIAKLEKEKKVIGETAISLDAMTDEEKQKLIEQLLASKSSEGENATEEDKFDFGEEKAEPAVEPTENEVEGVETVEHTETEAEDTAKDVDEPAEQSDEVDE